MFSSHGIRSTLKPGPSAFFVGVESTISQEPREESSIQQFASTTAGFPLNNSDPAVIKNRYGIAGNNLPMSSALGASATHALQFGFRFPSVRSVLWDATDSGPKAFLGAEDVLPSTSLQPQVLSRLLHTKEKDVPMSGKLGVFAAKVTDDRSCVGFEIERYEDKESHECPDEEESVFIDVVGNDNSISQEERQAEVEEKTMQCWVRRGPVSPAVLLRPGIMLQTSIGEKEDANHMDLSLSVQIALPSITVVVSAIRCLRILPTPLSKSLAAAQAVGASKRHQPDDMRTGFLTVDSCRRCIPMHVRDPKAYEWPLVGIWVSDVGNLYDTLVWLACVSFCFNQSVSERVNQNGSFLLLLYCRDERSPKMFQWNTNPAEVERTDIFKHFATAKELPLGEVFSSSSLPHQFRFKPRDHSMAEKLSAAATRQLLVSYAPAPSPAPAEAMEMQCPIPSPPPSPTPVQSAHENVTTSTVTSGQFQPPVVASTTTGEARLQPPLTFHDDEEVGGHSHAEILLQLRAQSFLVTMQQAQIEEMQQQLEAFRKLAERNKWGTENLTTHPQPVAMQHQSAVGQDNAPSMDAISAGKAAVVDPGVHERYFGPTVVVDDVRSTSAQTAHYVERESPGSPQTANFAVRTAVTEASAAAVSLATAWAGTGEEPELQPELVVGRRTAEPKVSPARGAARAALVYDTNGDGHLDDFDTNQVGRIVACAGVAREEWDAPAPEPSAKDVEVGSSPSSTPPRLLSRSGQANRSAARSQAFTPPTPPADDAAMSVPPWTSASGGVVADGDISLIEIPRSRVPDARMRNDVYVNGSDDDDDDDRGIDMKYTKVLGLYSGD